MKQCFILLFVMAICFQAGAQKKEFLDFKGMKKEVTAKKSAFFYPKLKKRFLSGDSLSRKEAWMLLYGYTCQPEYNAQNNKIADSVYQLNDLKKYTEALALAEKSLDKEPCNPGMYKEMAFSAEKTGNAKKRDLYYKSYVTLAGSMLATGTGEENCDSAILVLRIADEYLLMRAIGYKPSGQVGFTTCASTQMPMDRISVTYPDGGTGEMYFNISLFDKPTGSKAKKKKK